MAKVTPPTSLPGRVRRLEKARNLMLKIEEQCERWRFTRETFVNITVEETKSSNLEDGRAAILMNLIAISSSLFGIKPQKTLEDLIGIECCNRIRIKRNEASHNYANIPEKNDIDYDAMWTLIDVEFDDYKEKIEKAIKKETEKEEAVLNCS